MICPGSRGDAEGTFSQAMNGVAFFSTLAWKNTVSITERPSISCNAKHISDDVSSRVRIQRPIG